MLGPGDTETSTTDISYIEVPLKYKKDLLKNIIRVSGVPHKQ